MAAAAHTLRHGAPPAAPVAAAPRPPPVAAAPAAPPPPRRLWDSRHAGGLLMAAAAGGGAAAGFGAAGLFSGFQAVAQAATAVCLLAAAVPPLLSTQAGTRLLCAAASRALPGDVRVQRIRADWVSPLSVEGLEMLEGRGDGSRRLLAIRRITTAEPMYRLVFGGAITLTVAEPAVDATLDDEGLTPRLLKHVRAARLLSVILTPPQAHAAGAPADAPAAAEGAGVAGERGGGSFSGSAAAARLESHPLLATATGSETLQEASEQQHEPGPAPVPGAALSAAAAAPAKAPPAAGGGAGAAPPKRPGGRGGRGGGGVSALRRRLSVADAAAGFSVEVRAPRLNAVVSEGRLLVPREIREALGRHVHATMVVGADEVRGLAEEMGDDASWVDNPEAPPPEVRERQRRRADAAARRAAGGGGGEAGAEEAEASADGAPMALQVDSERLAADARGWALAGGGWRCVLERPVRARAELTPEFASMTLAEFNPLLSDTLSVRDGGRLALSFAPAGGALPAAAGTLRVEPVRLAVGEGQLLTQVLRLLNLGGLFGGPGGGLGSLLFGGGGGPRRQLEAWTGPMEVEVGADGVCSTRRVDMLLGGRVRVSVWGSVDTVTEEMRMRIGLPASTLALAGVKGLAPDYVLPLDLQGGLRSPHLDWGAAVRKVAVLSAMQLGRSLGGGGGGGVEGKAGAAPGAAAAAAPGAGLGAGPGAAGGGGGGGGGGAPLASMGSAMRTASQVFLQQCIVVDNRLQAELGDAAPPAVDGPAPWERAGAPAAGVPPAGGGGA